ncbi:hypothetical protein MPSEU_000258200 [Mayamaea pseudoterrestris]|nr:hypothetical protein MPSEU_000258200 [Mayamaea pseudoterrestris]
MTSTMADKKNDMHNSNRPLTMSNRNHTSPNLLEYGFANMGVSPSLPPPPPAGLSRKGSGGQRMNHGANASSNYNHTLSTSSNSPTKLTKKGVVIAIEDDDEDLFPVGSNEDVIPGPPAGSVGVPRTEKSTSRSRGLIQRVLHAGQHYHHHTTSSSSHAAAIMSQSMPTANGRSVNNSVETDVLQCSQLSNTEHNWAGAGILANRQDLEMPPEQFAAGCNLLQAAARGDVSAMRLLLADKKTNVDFRDYDRRTAMHVAASEGHLHVCKFLIEECQARLNRSDRWGGSPLDDAHRHRHQQVALYLRNKGASTGSGNRLVNFIKAAADGDLDEVTMILDATAKEAKAVADRKAAVAAAINTTPVANGQAAAPVFDINKGDYNSRTALHLAAGEGHVAIVNALCEAGADVNVEDRWHRTPLDDAIQNRHDECQHVLEKYGAHVGSAMSASMIQQQEQSSPDFLDASSRRQQDNMQVQFDELEMIDKIGSGAFGEIYKCRWRGTLVAAKIIKTAKIRRDWVIKRMSKALNDGKDVDDAIKEIDEAELDQEAKVIALADFRQEISVLKGLRHPHIVLLLAYSTTENYECLISELMKCSLLDIFKAHIIQGSKMRHRTAIVYARQLAQGMTYLHSCRPPIIHRDLKPANLLIDHSGAKR